MNCMINPKQMKNMMKQLGMNMVEIPAIEVVIKTEEKDIIISEPKVAKVNAMGQETFQITGVIEERESTDTADSDVKLIMDQTGVSEEKARKVLEETRDIAEAIMKLQKD